MTVMTNEELKPEENPEVESILSDLDIVLCEMGLTGASPTPAPAPAPILPPVAKSATVPSNAPAPANLPPVARPAPINPLEVQKQSTPKPVPEASAEIKRPTATGKPAPVSAQELKVELGPAKGISNPSTPQARSSQSSSPPQKKVASPAAYKPPLEIKLDAAVPAKLPEKTQAAASPPANPPAPSETSPRTAVPEAVPGAKAVPKVAPPAASLIHVTVASVEIPENVPKDRIRPLAFLFMAGGKAKFDEFVQFIDSMSLHLGKKPLYLRKIVVLELPAAVDFQAVVNEVRASGAAGTIGLLPDSIARGLEEAFSQAGSFFRFVHPEDVGKRSAALDLLVDVTLLPAV